MEPISLNTDFENSSESLKPATVNIYEDMNWFSLMTSIIQNKSGDSTMDEHFYQTLINNKLSQVATAMRVNFTYYDGGIIPANNYSFLLAASGSGKGRTNAMLEDLFFKESYTEFLGLFAEQSRLNLALLSEQKSRREGMEESLALTMLERRFAELPRYLFAYNDATEAGFKAIREKLTMASVGSTNIELDELGINMDKVAEFLSSILEAYDTGRLKQKLIKMDSAEDTIAIPASFLSFGTGSTLLDGAEKEKKFMEMLRQGMARRCSFSYSDAIATSKESGCEFDPFAILASARCTSDTSAGKDISHMIRMRITDRNVGYNITVPNSIWAKLLVFENSCKLEASKLSEFEDLISLNLVHSYWQVAKLMSIYAFIDGKNEVELIHYETAVNYIKESHKQFKMLVKTKSNGERLANFLCSRGVETTLFDLNDSLQFYRNGNKQQKQEMIELAQSYAATHSITIKHVIKDGIDYFTGERLEEINLNKMTLSTSKDITTNFVGLEGKWDELFNIPTQNINYSSHSFREGNNPKTGELYPGYRNKENAIPGFSLIILDIDSGVDLNTALTILDGQKYLITTTRSHQVLKNGVVSDRYRIFLPMTHRLEMEADEFSDFMGNVMEDFPIECDPSCKDISRFYYGFTGASHYYGEGELFDPTQYIPNTSVNEKRVITNKNIGDVPALEKYFLKRMQSGNRNNMMTRFAFALADSGESYENIEDRVYTMNSKLEVSLPPKELSSTVLSSVRKKVYGGVS